MLADVTLPVYCSVMTDQIRVLLDDEDFYAQHDLEDDEVFILFDSKISPSRYKEQFARLDLDPRREVVSSGYDEGADEEYVVLGGVSYE